MIRSDRSHSPPIVIIAVQYLALQEQEMLFWLLALTIPLIVFVLRRANLGFVRREVKLEIVPRTAVTTGNEVLVTGGMGFIGSAVTKALVDRGNCSVRVMDIALPPAEKRDARITYIRGDIGNMEHVKTALNGVHSVFHIAGIIPNLRIPDSECFRVNVHGTRNIVEGIDQMLHLLSSSRMQNAWSASFAVHKLRHSVA